MSVSILGTGNMTNEKKMNQLVFILVHSGVDGK